MATNSFASVQIMDNLGYWNEVIQDVISLDGSTGYRDGNLTLSNRRLAPAGTLKLALNNSAKKYSPADNPGNTSILSPWRRCRVRMTTPSMGNILQMMSSGIGVPGTRLDTLTGRTGTKSMGLSGSANQLQQQFLTFGGTIAAFSFWLATNTGTNPNVQIDWQINLDSGGAPTGAIQASGTMTPTPNALNTVPVSSTLFFATGTLLWVSIKYHTTFAGGGNYNLYTSNGTVTYNGTIAVNGAADNVDGNFQMALQMTPQGTVVQQTVAQSGNAGDIFSFSLDIRSQWDSQYNLVGVFIYTNSDIGNCIQVAATNKFITSTLTFTAQSNYTSITVLVCAAHNNAALNSIYTEIRNCALTVNAGANILVNGNFSSGLFTPWTETSQTDIALYGTNFYDTDVQLRGQSFAGGAGPTQSSTGNTTAIGGVGGTSNQQVTQSFTPTTSGILSQIQINFAANNNTPGGQIALEIWTTATSASGIGYTASKRLVRVLITALPGGLNTFNVTNGPTLINGTEYLLVLYSVQVQTGNNAWQINNSTSDVYAGGKLGTSSGNGSNVGPTAGSYIGHPPHYVPGTPGVTWADTGFDMAFTITTAALPVKDKLAQNFMIFANQQVSSLKLRLVRIGSAAGTMTARIETDSAGQPSGTLVNVNATANVTEASLPNHSGNVIYDWITFTFPAAFSLSLETPYWIVLSTTRVADGITWIDMATAAITPDYLNGVGAMYYQSSGTYTAENKVAMLDVIASSYSSLAVVNDSNIVFNGFIQDIQADAHQNAGNLQTLITCVDFLHLLTITMFNLQLQANLTEDAAIAALLAALPSGTLTTTPVGTLIDAGKTTFPYAFDGYVTNKVNNDPGQSYLFSFAGSDGVHELIRPVQNRMMIQQALDDVLKSSHGRFWADEDGTLRFANREQTVALQSKSAAINVLEGSAGVMGSAVSLTAAMNVVAMINQVFITYHPRQVSTGTVVLGQMNIPPNVSLAAYQIPPKTHNIKTGNDDPGTFVITITFRDSAGKPIGATAVNAPVYNGTSSSDYELQNTEWGTQPFGSVYDITSKWTNLVGFSYSVTASQAVVTFRNTSSHPVYIAKFQMQGTALYTLDPVTIEVSDNTTISPFWQQFALIYNLDQPYTSDPNFSASLAQYIYNRYNKPLTEGHTLEVKNEVSLVNQDSSVYDVMKVSLFDVVKAADTQAGLGASGHLVVGKQWKYDPHADGIVDDMKYILERQDPTKYIVLDDATYGFVDGPGVMYI